MDKGRRRAAVQTVGVQTHARQNMEERLKAMEEINNKNIVKMQQSHRIQAKVYEKMLSEQELFWKEQLAEKEDQMRQMEAEIDELRSRELVLVGEMEAIEQRAMEGSTTLTQNFMEAYQQLGEAMVSLQRMKVSIEDTKKKKKERRQRKEKEREERHQRSRPSDEEEESDGFDAAHDTSLLFKSFGGAAYNNRASGSVDHDWKRQIQQLDGKWFQIKDIMEAMREEMEQKSMLGSAALKQSFVEAYEHLSECMELMESVKRELEEQARRRRKEHKPGNKDCWYRRWYRKIQTGMGMGMQGVTQISAAGGAVSGHVVDHVAQWTGMGGGRGGGGWGQTTPRRSSPRRSSPRRSSPRARSGRRSPLARLGRSRSRQQQQRDDV